MGIVSKIKEKVKSGYNRADAYLGGNLPGGVPSGTGLTKYNAPTSIGGYGGSPNNVPNSSSSPSTSTTRTYSGSSGGGGRSSGSTTAQQNVALTSGTAITGGSGGIMQTGTELDPRKGGLTPGSLSNQIIVNPAAKNAEVLNYGKKDYSNKIAANKPLTYGQATVQSGKNVVLNVAGAFGFGDGAGQDVFRPFKRAGEEKIYYGGISEDVVSYYKPNYGTKQYTSMGVEKPFFEGITIGEEEKAKKADFAFKSNLITERDTRRANNARTEEEFNVINEEYKQSQKDLYESFDFKEKQTKFTGERYPPYIKAYIKTVPDVLVGASTLIPGSQAVTVPLAIGYFVGKGAILASIKPSKEEAFADINQAMFQYSQGEEVKEPDLFSFDNIRKTYLGGEEFNLRKRTETPLFEEYTSLRNEATVSFGGALLQAPGTFNLIGNQINSIRVADLQSAKIRTIGKVLDFGDEKLLKTYSIARTGTGQLSVKGEFPLFAADEGKFIVGSGRGSSTTKILDWFKQGTPKFGSNPYTITRKTFTGAARGIVDDALIGVNNKAFVGEGYFVKGDKLTRLNFQGLSNTQDDLTQGFSGNIESTKFYKQITGASYDIDTGYLNVNLRTTTKSPIQNFFRVIEKPSVSDDFLSFGGKSFYGGNGLSQVGKQSFNFGSKGGTAFAGEVAKNIQSSLTSQSTKATSFFGTTSFIKNNFEQESVLETKSLTKSFIQPALEVNNFEQSRVRGGFSFGSSNVFKDLNINKGKQIITPVFRQPQVERYSMKTLTANPFSGIGTNSFIPKDFGFKPAGGYLPGIKLFDYGRTRRSKGGKRVKGQYAPTITSLALNIKSSNIDKLYSKGAGAFSIRPIISTSKSSRRTKSSPRMARNRRKQRRDWWLR